MFQSIASFWPLLLLFLFLLAQTINTITTLLHVTKLTVCYLQKGKDLN